MYIIIIVYLCVWLHVCVHVCTWISRFGQDFVLCEYFHSSSYYYYYLCVCVCVCFIPHQSVLN